MHTRLRRPRKSANQQLLKLLRDLPFNRIFWRLRLVCFVYFSLCGYPHELFCWKREIRTYIFFSYKNNFTTLYIQRSFRSRFAFLLNCHIAIYASILLLLNYYFTNFLLSIAKSKRALCKILPTINLLNSALPQSFDFL